MTKNTKKTGTTQQDLTQILKWRLAKAPTLDDVTTMLDKGVVSKDEARQLLFNVEEPDTTPISEKEKALKEQIKFLEGVVEKLSQRGSVTVWPTITYYPTYPTKYWYFGGSIGNSGGYITSAANSTVTLSSTVSSGNSGVSHLSVNNNTGKTT